MKRTAAVVFAALVLLAGGLGPVQAEHEPNFGTTGMEVIGAFRGYWWDHTTLTVAIKGAANAPADADDAVVEAIEIWNDAIAHRHGEGFIEMVVVTDKQAVAKADIVVNLHRSGGQFAGVAICQSGKRCQVPMWESGPRGTGSEPYTYDEMVNLALHELGHAIGVGHAIPLYGTPDFMGYDITGWDNNTVSACAMDAFDAAWEWAIKGEAPHPAVVTKVAC